ARAGAHVAITRGATPEAGIVGLFAKLSRQRFVYSSANVSDFRATSAHAASSSKGSQGMDRGGSVHFDFSRFPRRQLEWRLFRLAIRLADKIVVQTDEQARLCEARFGRSPTVIRSIAETAPAGFREPEAFLWI